ncbi:MAG: hypothetical protein ACI9OJ_005157, partial [Myxococcota bacterium]
STVAGSDDGSSDAAFTRDESTSAAARWGVPAA